MITHEQLISFNPEQLCTWNEAKTLIAKLLQTPIDGKVIGGGLRPLTDDPNTSGIYIFKWEGGPQSFPEPRIGKARAYMFRFNNGFSGMNCGLVRELFSRYPTAPDYVRRQLRGEVERPVQTAR